MFCFVSYMRVNFLNFLSYYDLNEIGNCVFVLGVVKWNSDNLLRGTRDWEGSVLLV